MKKRSLKEIFLSLFAGARSHADDKPMGDSFESPSARAQAISETGSRLMQKTPGPPADWLAKRSAGPPAHWVELMRRATPEMPRNGKRDEADATSQLQDLRQIQRKPAPPLRLERPAPASRSSLDSTRKPIRRTESRPDDQRRSGRRKQEPSLLSFPVNKQKQDADDLGKNSNQSPAPRDTTVRSGDHTVATQLQTVEAPAQAKPNLQENICAIAPLRKPELDEASCSQERKDVTASKTLFKIEQATGSPDIDEGRPQVRKVVADDGAEAFSRPTFSYRQNYEQENVGQKNSGQKNVNSWPEHLRNFSTGAEHREFQTPSAIGAVEVTRRQVVSYFDVSRAEAQRAQVSADRVALDLGDGKAEWAEESVTNPVEPVTGQVRLTERQDKSFAAHRCDASSLLASCDSETGASKQISPNFITSTPAPTSYDVSEGRWPALFEPSADDHLDDAMAAWRELSRNRRLAREQTGSLWSE